MIYTELTRKAMVIAYNAHHGQEDKSGVPYIFHPVHLAEQMHDEYSVCVALLHDTVEDTNLTLDDLAKEFPKEIVDAVSLLTHDKSESYETYLKKIKTNSLAMAVKMADVEHNSTFARIPSGASHTTNNRQIDEEIRKSKENLEREKWLRTRLLRTYTNNICVGPFLLENNAKMW